MCCFSYKIAPLWNSSAGSLMNQVKTRHCWVYNNVKLNRCMYTLNTLRSKGDVDAHSFLLSIHMCMAHIYVQLCCSHNVLKGFPLPPPPLHGHSLHQFHTWSREYHWQCTLTLLHYVYGIASFGQVKGTNMSAVTTTHQCTYVHALQPCVLAGMQYPKARPHSCHPLHHEITRSHLRGQLAGCRG